MWGNYAKVKSCTKKGVSSYREGRRGGGKGVSKGWAPVVYGEKTKYKKRERECWIERKRTEAGIAHTATPREEGLVRPFTGKNPLLYHHRDWMLSGERGATI